MPVFDKSLRVSGSHISPRVQPDQLAIRVLRGDGRRCALALEPFAREDRRTRVPDPIGARRYDIQARSLACARSPSRVAAHTCGIRSPFHPWGGAHCPITTSREPTPLSPSPQDLATDTCGLERKGVGSAKGDGAPVGQPSARPPRRRRMTTSARPRTMTAAAQGSTGTPVAATVPPVAASASTWT